MKEFIWTNTLRLLACTGFFLSPLFKKKIDHKHISKILIFQGGGIGDVIRLFPAIQLTCLAFPKASIKILSSTPNELLSLLPNYSSINRLIIYDLPSKHKGISGKIKLVKELRSHSFDLIFNPSKGKGMMENAIICLLAGSRYRIGFSLRGLRFFNTVSTKFNNEENILSQNTKLLSQTLNISIEQPNVYLKIPESTQIFWDNFSCKFKLTENDILVAVSPSAKWRDSTTSWPMEKYLELIKLILNLYPIHVVILGDKLTGSKLANSLQSNSRLINMAGQTSIPEAALLIKHSHLFIGNDSGLLHLATALETETVAIFGPTLPQQVVRLNKFLKIVTHDLSCQPCYTHKPFQNINCKHRECLEEIKVTQVVNKVEQILKMKI